MGLDMYLVAEKYHAGYEHCSPEEKQKYRDVLKAVGITQAVVCAEAPSLRVHVTVAYWRKVNAVHQWFVDNCQNGIDECQDSFVTREQLMTLRDLAMSVLAHKDEDLAIKELPPVSGFFFGSTEIDEWYWIGLRDTVEQLDRVLLAPELEDCDFYYRSSW